MKNNKIKEIKWRKLDNTAKIFPIITSKKFSNIYRLSVLLKEEIQKDLLQLALEQTLEVFAAFKIRIKKGLFWYYFETNLKKPLVKKENNYPCKNIDTISNHDYLLRVSYFHTKINVEIFHSITDGTGAMSFIKLLTYYYLSLCYPNKLGQVPSLDTFIAELTTSTTEDGYLTNYTKQGPQKLNLSYAYTLKGSVLPLYAVGVIHAHMNLPQLLLLCKKKKVTITEFFTAQFIFAIYQEHYHMIRKNRPIKIYVPVNLKKFFHSATVSNFFSYITVATPTEKEMLTDFDVLLNFVKQEFETKLTKDSLSKKISTNVSTEKNIGIRLLPLFIKKYSVKLGYREASKHHTSTISNIGKFEILKDYEDYIDSFLFVLPPSMSEKMKCTICSYQDDLVFTFCSSLTSNTIERTFLKNIAKCGIAISLESNGVYNEKM